MEARAGDVRMGTHGDTHAKHRCPEAPKPCESMSDHRVADALIAGGRGFRLAKRMVAHDLQRQYYEMLMESQFGPPEQLLAHQRTQLAHLLRHARAQPPRRQEGRK